MLIPRAISAKRMERFNDATEELVTAAADTDSDGSGNDVLFHKDQQRGAVLTHHFGAWCKYFLWSRMRDIRCGDTAWWEDDDLLKVRHTDRCRILFFSYSSSAAVSSSFYLTSGGSQVSDQWCIRSPTYFNSSFLRPLSSYLSVSQLLRTAQLESRSHLAVRNSLRRSSSSPRASLQEQSTYAIDHLYIYILI